MVDCKGGAGGERRRRWAGTYLVVVGELHAFVLVQQLLLVHLVLLGEERQLPVLDLQHELADVDKRLEVDVLRDLELVQVKVEGVVVFGPGAEPLLSSWPVLTPQGGITDPGPPP